MPYASFYAYIKRYADAIRLAQRAVDLEPNLAVRHHVQGVIYLTAGDEEAAYSAFQRALGLNSAGQLTQLELGRIETLRGDYPRALERFRVVETLTQGIRVIGYAAYAYARAGSPEDARRLFNQIQERAKTSRIPPQSWVYAYLAVGDYTQALYWLDVAADTWNSIPVALVYIRENIFHDPVLEQPEFVAVRQKIGFKNL